MTKEQRVIKTIADHIELILRPSFPVLSDECLRTHAVSAAILLFNGIIRDAELQVTGTFSRDVGIVYECREK